MQVWKALREALAGGWGWAAFALAAGLQVVSWPLSGFSHDEFSALRRVLLTDSWEGFWSQAVLVDAHPAGVQAFLTGWVGLGELMGVGLAPLWVKFPFLVASLSGLVALVLVVRRLVGREAAWLAVVVYGGLHWVVLQSGIARPYGAGVAAVLWGAAVLVAPSVRGRVWKLGVAWAAAAYLHHFAALEAGLVWAAAMVWGRPEDRRAVGWSAGVGLALYAPHVPVLWHQWGHGGLGGFLAPPEAAFVSEYLSLLLNDSVVVWGVLLGPAMGAALGVRSGRVWRAVGLGVGLFVVPFGLAFAYSIWRAPILMDRTLFFAAPFFVMALAIAAMAGWQRWTGFKPAGYVGLAGIATVTALFVNRQHHRTAWESTYELVYEAALAHPEAFTVLNGPDLAWKLLEGQTHWRPANVHPDSFPTIQRASADPRIASIAIGRAANHRYLTPDADALLWFHRPLLEQRDGYNGDYRLYGLPRGPEQAPAAMVVPGRISGSTGEFGPTVVAALPELMQACSLSATTTREVYAGVQLPDSVPADVELVLTVHVGEEPHFYRSVRPDRRGGAWLAVGVRLADLALRPQDLASAQISAYLWNPSHHSLTTGPLLVSGAKGNPLQYAWSQRIPQN